LKVDCMRPEFPIPSEDLNAYVDDELSDEEHAAVDAALADHEAGQRELEEIRGLVSLLGGLPQYEPPRSFALSPEHIREARSSSNVLRFLPVVRSLSIAAVVAFMVVTSLVVFDRVGTSDDANDGDTNAGIVDTSGTDAPADASKDSTGDSAPESSGLLDRGDSAASNAVPTEAPSAPISAAAAPGGSDLAQADSTPTATEAAPEETPVSVATTSDSDDDDNRWLITSAGLGVLALVLIGLWMVLVRTGRAQRQSTG
jgi:hypothetical protein